MGIAVVHYSGNGLNCVDDLKDAICNINHSGQVRCGIVTHDGDEFYRTTNNGLVNTLDIPYNMKGSYGIGCVSNYPDHQPLIFYSKKFGNFALSFDGFIFNRDQLRADMDASLSNFDPTLAGAIISRGADVVDGIHKLSDAIKGCYCLGIITEDGKSYAARCPLATKPLMLGSGKAGNAVITESRAFRKMGMRPSRDVKPGEIIMMDQEGFETADIIQGDGMKICSFLWGYSSWVDSDIEGVPVGLVRERLASRLAERDKRDKLVADVVTAIEDSGKAYGEGYAEAFGLPYKSITIKYPYFPRSYTQPKDRRGKVARGKHSTVDFRVNGKRIVLLDDSLRRGTVTDGGPIDYLWEAGAEEIHLRFGTPRNHHYCRLDYIEAGDDTLPANRFRSDEDLAKVLKVDSVRFPTEDDVIEAITTGSNLIADNLCLSCYSSGDFGFLE
jgi:amidophosphoribosyltransferase